MATKYFCDYCGKEVQTFHGPLVMKMISPKATGEDDRTKVFHELCAGCYGHLRETFNDFIDGIGDLTDE